MTEAQKKAYVIADNKLALNAGWDLEVLKLEIDELQELGFDVGVLGFDPSELFFDEPNYDALDDEDLNSTIDEMASDVKKAIQIEFDIQDYQEAQDLIKFWRNEGAYVGDMIIQHLKEEKNKL